MKPVREIVILEGARTPIGSFLGGLSEVTATDLGATAARGAIERANVDPGSIDSIHFGNVIQSSKDAAYLARHVGLKAGAPIETLAVTINRACGSGLDAIIAGARSLLLDEARVVLAGGAENMSMTPYAMRGVRKGWKMVQSRVDDMLFSALHDPMAGCSIGETVEELAEEMGITRTEADEIAVWGQGRAAAARDAGVLAQEIVPVSVPGRGSRIVEADECLRPETNMEVLAGLPGLYRTDGVVTAGNSCGLNDAGAAVVMTTSTEATRLGLEPLGCVRSWAAVGVDPRRMGLGPVGACRRALDRAGLSLDEMDVIEINDSFTVQYLAVERALGLDRNKVNISGGAIALGHPMAATGTRLALSALYGLRRTGGRYALCTVCVGGGQGVALVLSAHG